MNEKELLNRINQLEKRLERYELQEIGIYEPKHVLNTKTEFTKSIRANLREQRIQSNPNNLFDKTGLLPTLMVKNFNWQCSDIIKELNGYNLKSAKEKIVDRANELISLCDANNMRVKSHKLFQLKIEQATLENDYLIFQAEEKYRKQEQARKIAEQRKADKELFDKLERIEKQIRESLAFNDYDKATKLGEEAEITKKLLREQKAGWIYVISNEDMKDGYVKVGTTRRENPLVRVNELSNASHAFRFKVHAFIYSEDCFGLESQLHRRLAGYRVNKGNPHKEFFEISLDELQEILKDEFDIEVKMNDDIYDDDEILNKIYSYNVE